MVYQKVRALYTLDSSIWFALASGALANVMQAEAWDLGLVLPCCGDRQVKKPGLASERMRDGTILDIAASPARHQIWKETILDHSPSQSKSRPEKPPNQSTKS